MALWRDGAFVDDVWTKLADDASLPEQGPAIVSLDRWRREAGSLARARERRGGDRRWPEGDRRRCRRSRTGRWLRCGSRSSATAARSPMRSCCASATASRGELRAVGDVLLDEIPLMIRCGFSSFDVTNEATLRALREARLPKFPVAYQPGLSAGETRDASRPWARRLAVG